MSADDRTKFYSPLPVIEMPPYTFSVNNQSINKSIQERWPLLVKVGYHGHEM
jgi:hypothetical protein